MTTHHERESRRSAAGIADLGLEEHPVEILTTIDPAACTSASPVDIEAASAPAQKSPMTTAGRSSDIRIVGRMASAGVTPGKRRMPANPMKRIGIREDLESGVEDHGLLQGATVLGGEDLHEVVRPETEPERRRLRWRSSSRPSSTAPRWPRGPARSASSGTSSASARTSSPRRR